MDMSNIHHDDAFLFSRFWAFLKLLFISNSQKLKLWLAVCFAVTLGIHLLLFFSLNDMAHDWVYVLLASAGIFSILLCGCLGLSANAFKSYKHRDTAWQIMLLPVSRFEKYSAHFAYSVLALPFLLMLVFCLALGISYGIAQLGGQEPIFLGPIIRSMFRPFSSMQILQLVVNLTLVAIMGGIYYSTSFFLGGLVWRKHPILCGMFLSWGMSMVMGFVSNQLVSFPNMFEDGGQDVSSAFVSELGAWAVGTWVCLFAVALACFAFGWILYKRQTVP